MQDFFFESPKLAIARDTLVHVFLGCLDPLPPVAKSWNDFALFMNTYGTAIIEMNEDLFISCIVGDDGDHY